jgi:hypothetical protein
VRDREFAADVLRRTFATEQADEPSAYRTARDHALAALTQRRRLAGAEAQYREALDFTRLETDRLREPAAVIFDRELIELVWESAAALPPDEYALLDLHVRRRLAAEELDETQTRLARLREAFEETVYTTLLITRGRRACDRLDAALSERETAEARHAAQKHIRGCRRCQDAIGRFVPPLEIFAAFALIPAPSRLFGRQPRRGFGRARG